MRGGIPATRRARQLRRNPTDAERALWEGLRRKQLGWRFRRQVAIPPYFADLACVEAKLIVEADGLQHSEAGEHERRDLFLQQKGWRVLRFWNNEILQNREGVIGVIAQALGPPPRLPAAP